MSKQLEVDDLIASLCINAPNDDVKFCLRNYEYSKDITQIEKDLDKLKKTILCETAEYLKIPNYLSKNKQPLIHLIVCRIQNLLPDDCSICNSRYKIDINENPLLECSKCGQGVHRECMIQLVTESKTTGIDPDSIDSNVFQQLFNPLNIPGIYYICDACRDSTIPSDGNGDCKKKKKVEFERVDMIKNKPSNSADYIEITDISNHISDDSDDKEVQEEHVMQPDDMISVTQNNEQQLVEDQIQFSTVQPEPIMDRKPNICRFYTKGKCRHGLKGKECKYTHPKKCKKFVEHGTRQPRGCNLGKNCKDFHPKMCMNSLRKGECYSQTCPFEHVKGTKRHKPVHENIVNKSDITGEENMNETNNFLELIRLMKAEILQTLNQKMSIVTNQMQTLQTQSMGMFQQAGYQMQPPLQIKPTVQQQATLMPHQNRLPVPPSQIMLPLQQNQTVRPPPPMQTRNFPTQF